MTKSKNIIVIICDNIKNTAKATIATIIFHIRNLLGEYLAKMKVPIKVPNIRAAK